MTKEILIKEDALSYKIFFQGNTAVTMNNDVSNQQDATNSFYLSFS